MRVAYTSAVVVELLNQGIYLNYVAGISAGSSNLVNYMSRDPERARRSFVEFAEDPNMGGLGTFLRGKGMFNAHYIYQETPGPDGPLPLDFDTLTNNPAQLRIGAFRADDGEMVYFTHNDIPRIEDLMVRVQASSTMPILMPPVEIGEHTYVDGALGPSGGIPLDVAIRDGYERFLIILTQPQGFRKQPQRHAALIKAWFRKYPAVYEALMDRHHRYNASLEQVAELEHEGKAMVFYPQTMPLTNGTRSVEKLAVAHQAGLVQARREIPAWRDWLGLPYA